MEIKLIVLAVVYGLILILFAFLIKYLYNRIKYLELEKLRKSIKESGAADVVEVVRCKDCINRNTEDCAMYYQCICGEQHTWESNNDYCSWGKRKTMEGEK